MKLCLNMIVKNESKIIIRLLDSIINIIDTYCICDTGSTDNTVNIIKEYFSNKNVNGIIFNEPFVNFEYNRNIAIEKCKEIEDVDYLLLMDADMLLKYNDNFNIENFKNFLGHYDIHYIFQGNQNFQYKNIRIVKNNLLLKYSGVTHEYLNIPKNATYSCFSEYDIFINDVGDGGSKQNKFNRDIDLLTNALIKEPTNERYIFYLANSYENVQNYESAIEKYNQRTKLSGWIEEIWYSYYSIGNCYKILNQDEKSIYNWLMAYNVFPNRIENLYKIIEHYRSNCNYTIAHEFFKLADKIRNNTKNFDFLFLEKDVYEYKLNYELSIIGYYIKENNYDMVHCCWKLLNKNIPDIIKHNVLCNYKYYCPVLEGEDFTSNIKMPSFIKKDFINSTPSICKHNNDIFINIRFVNYRIDNDGNYKTNKTIENINILCKYDYNFKERGYIILNHNKSLDNTYVGLEDIRLFSHNYLYFNANRGLKNKFKVEHGIINSNGTIKSLILTKDNEFDIEKNWVLFSNNENKLSCVYSWYPLVIGNIQFNKFFTTNTINTPLFFKNIRCSSNGVSINDEVWFLCHYVSYENRRHYYHCFIIIDKYSYEVKNYTCLFTFEKKPVEYSLGFIFHKDNIIIGYSIIDSTTQFKKVSINKIQELFLLNR